MKKKLAIILTLAMLVCCIPASAFAAEDSSPGIRGVIFDSEESEASMNLNAANSLYELGLFKGVGTNADGTPVFALEKSANRIEGLVMLIRLLGEDEVALSFEGECPFTDVPTWAKSYVAYAYDKGYTTGSSKTTFGTGALTPNAFLTFVLRALGYADVNYNYAYATAGYEGLIDKGEYVDQKQTFFRGDCAKVAHNALLTCIKGTDETLVDKLVSQKAVTAEAVKTSGIKTHNLYGTDKNLDRVGWLEGYMVVADKTLLNNSKDFGLPENMEWCSNPTKLSEYYSNMLYAFLIGSYEFCYYNKQQMRIIPAKPIIVNMGLIHGDLVGAYCNVDLKGFGIYNDYLAKGYIGEVDWAPSTFGPSEKEVFAQEIEAYLKAKEIITTLHDNGKLKDTMTEKERADVIYNYLLSYGVRTGEGGDDGWSNGKNMLYDSVYSCLIAKKADCNGRASAYTMLLNIEGIEATNYNSQGHVLTRFKADEKFYISDWGNKLGTVEEGQSLASWITFSDMNKEINTYCSSFRDILAGKYDAPEYEGLFD